MSFRARVAYFFSNLTKPLIDFALVGASRLLRKELGVITGTLEYWSLAPTASVNQKAQTGQRIREFVAGDSPFLIGRFGSTEFRAVMRSEQRAKRTVWEKIYAALAAGESPFWVPWEHSNLKVKSGFFPISKRATDAFVEIYRGAILDTDLLGMWVPGENFMEHLFRNSELTDLESLSPFGVPNPWTEVLRGKRVLVVHPFEETIKNQYRKRLALHNDPGILPEFELLTVRAVQSLGGASDDFETWFDALKYMHELTREKTFDVALVACGAYGLPLGSLMKADGQKVIVLGGILQLLFGIKGKRWDDSGLYNASWVRPLESERPSTYFGADQGAYW